MAIGLIAWGRRYLRDAHGNMVLDASGRPQRITVPAPNTDPGKPWLYEFLRANAKRIARTADFVQFPPSALALGGQGAGCDGYGVTDRYALDGTRYGPQEDLMAAVAALHAYGCESSFDAVLHQMMGGRNRTYLYPGADGTPGVGRDALYPEDFRGREDEVPDPANDFAFGDELHYEYAPSQRTIAYAERWLKWLVATVGFKRGRIDDVKGLWAPAVRRWVDALGLPVNGEYFDGNPQNLWNWANSPAMGGRCGVLDFNYHFALQGACNSFDARRLAGQGYWRWNAGQATVFVDNPDTDTSDGEQIVFNKGIAYALALNVPAREALVYGKDYFPDTVWPENYGLYPCIDNIAWFSRMFAFGGYADCWVDEKVFAFTRDGAGGATGWSGGTLVAANFDTWSERTITVQTPFGANRWLHDYSGHARYPDVRTNRYGEATITIPSNAWSAGQSYVLFAPGGVDRPFPTASFQTEQVFEGDNATKLLAAKNGTHALPQRIFCRANTGIDLALSADIPAGGSVEIIVDGGAGEQIASCSLYHGVPANETRGTTKSSGWHTIWLKGDGLPDAGVNYRLATTYTGEQG